MSLETWKSALFDEGGTYRYLLCRRWDAGRPTVAFCMLNPSTADGTQDDATIRRCLAFATRWGYGELLITNCFALRSPQPGLLRTHPDPVGPDNRLYLLQAAERASCIVVAWERWENSSTGIWRCSRSWLPIPYTAWV